MQFDLKHIIAVKAILVFSRIANASYVKIRAAFGAFYISPKVNHYNLLPACRMRSPRIFYRGNGSNTSLFIAIYLFSSLVISCTLTIAHTIYDVNTPGINYFTSGLVL
jgi:hypothetical protein